MVLKDRFRILNRRWECLLMEEGRQGGCSRCSGTRALPRGLLVCPTLGLWRMGWDTFEGPRECSGRWRQKDCLGSRLDREGAQEEGKVGEMRSECEGQEREASPRAEVDGGR